MRADLSNRPASNRGRIWTQEEKDQIYQMRLNTMHSAKIAEKLGVTAEFLLGDEVTDPSEDVADKAFFRKYQKLPTPTKKQIQDILKVIQKDNEKDE